MKCDDLVGPAGGGDQFPLLAGAAVAAVKRGWECVGCWAFPDKDSRGTYDCKRRLEAIGLKVTEVKV